MNKKILFLGLLIILVVAILGVYFVQKNQENAFYYSSPTPEEVVRQYFTAWGNKNYPDMYSTISDGFKKIEPTANNLTSFRNYTNSQGIEAVNIINIKEKSNDGTTAEVDYSVKFVIGEGNESHENVDQKRDFSGNFTLKYRQGDVIHGWKLIHPYGANIDTA